MDEGAGEVNLLTHAGGVIGDERTAGTAEIQDVEELGGAGDDDIALQAAQQTGVGDQLESGEAVEGAQPVGKDAEPRFGGARPGPHVGAVDRGAAGVGNQQPGGHG